MISRQYIKQKGIQRDHKYQRLGGGHYNIAINPSYPIFSSSRKG